MSNLVGWTLVLIAVLLGLFLTDGPGSGEHHLMSSLLGSQIGILFLNFR